jgi:hypothetical protein
VTYCQHPGFEQEPHMISVALAAQGCKRRSKNPSLKRPGGSAAPE